SRDGVELLPFTPNLGDLYRSCDVFVFPTLEEGGPQVTLEAGGCGLPVITTPMGASRMVEHGRNGLIIEPGDVEGLAAAMTLMASDAHLRQRFARLIEEDVKAFAYDRVSDARASILKALLKSGAGHLRGVETLVQS